MSPRAPAVPNKQPKRGRLWLADGSCIRLWPEQRNHVWSYDFVEDRAHDGRRYRMLNVIDEFTHECLATRFARKLKAIDVTDLFILRGVPVTSGPNHRFFEIAAHDAGAVRALGLDAARRNRVDPDFQARISFPSPRRVER